MQIDPRLKREPCPVRDHRRSTGVLVEHRSPNEGGLILEIPARLGSSKSFLVFKLRSYLSFSSLRHPSAIQSITLPTRPSLPSPSQLSPPPALTMSWFASVAPDDGPNLHPVYLGVDQEALYGPLTPADNEWTATTSGFVTETQVRRRWTSWPKHPEPRVTFLRAGVLCYPPLRSRRHVAGKELPFRRRAAGPQTLKLTPSPLFQVIHSSVG